MIVILGSVFDKTLSYFSDYLVEKKQKFLFLNLDLLGDTIKINDTNLTIGNFKVNYNDITGVFNRMVVSLDNVRNNKNFMTNYWLLNYVLDFEIAKVINKPMVLSSNNSKPYQLSLLNINHIIIPKTYIYANQKFSVESNVSYVYKSISSWRSVVKDFNCNEMPSYTISPFMLQEKIDGINYRVHVVNNKSFSVRILSDSVDYRYYNEYLHEEEAEIPDEISKECIEITKQLELDLSGIDLIEKAGIFYILEVNTCPGYNSFEEKMNNKKISDAILERLV